MYMYVHVCVWVPMYMYVRAYVNMYTYICKYIYLHAEYTFVQKYSTLKINRNNIIFLIIIAVL